MTLWYVEDLLRFRNEREALQALALRADWLTPIRWRVDRDNFCLTYDADITAGGRTYPISVRYPHHFPHVPSLVFPRGEPSHWSSHQWGAGGELCLEFGPDNWTPDITGAQMVESAHRLLEGENPAPGEPATVASRHSMTAGQELRGVFARFLVTRELQQALSRLPQQIAHEGTMSVVFHKETFIYILDRLAFPDGATWTDPDVPEHLQFESREQKATVFRISADAELPPETSTSVFKKHLLALGCPTDGDSFVILRGDTIHNYRIYEETVWPRATILPEPLAKRLDDAHETLRGKRVAVIGCGSLGSKLCVMLARAGVGNFRLVDDDLMLPDNLVRHELDWREVGTLKAEAVARRLQLLSPAVVVDVSRIRLGGQEAAGTIETLLLALENCDLIIDATASPAVFNLLAALKGKPVIWAEVFGGGIGGLIARHRPDREPPPQFMRLAIENWFSDQGKPVPAPAIDYGTRGDGPPLIANDADVAAIAAHAARFAIDALIGREPSHFPHSVYAVGLGEGSVFTQPFDTRPIDVGPPLQPQPTATLTDDEEKAEYSEIGKLFGVSDETSPDA